MVSTKQYGTSGAANEAIGGVPTIHYFDFASKGRGQVVRLLWEDAGIAYTDVRYSFDEYPSFKKSQLKEMNPLDTIPVVELNGRILTQSYAIIRHFARQLGKYEGTNEEDKYWADAMCDVASDWRTRFVDAFFSDDSEAAYAKFKEGDRPRFLNGLNQQLKSHSSSIKGPYVTGNEITYADLVIYQICHDEGLTLDGRKGLQGYDRLIQLVDAVEARPNVKAFLKSDRYLG